MIKTHPQTFCRSVEDQGQEDGDGTAKNDESCHWHSLAGSQGNGDDDNQEFADDQVDGHGPSVVARLAFKDEAAHRAAFVGLEDAGENLSSAAHRAALAQPPSHQ